MEILEKVGRDVDLQLQHPAEIMDLQQAQPSTASRWEADASPASIMERIQRDHLMLCNDSQHWACKDRDSFTHTLSCELSRCMKEYTDKHGTGADCYTVSYYSRRNSSVLEQTGPHTYRSFKSKYLKGCIKDCVEMRSRRHIPSTAAEMLGAKPRVKPVEASLCVVLWSTHFLGVCLHPVLESLSNHLCIIKLHAAKMARMLSCCLQ